jgi:hypothetical protein
MLKKAMGFRLPHFFYNIGPSATLMMTMKATAPNIGGCLSFTKSIGMFKTLLYFIPFEKMRVKLLNE